MTAGVATAEVAFSGAAVIAIVDDNGAYAAATTLLILWLRQNCALKQR